MTSSMMQVWMLTFSPAVPVERAEKSGGDVSVEEVTAGLFLSWEDQNYCAPKLKDMLDGVLTGRQPGYNVPFVTVGDDDDDDDDEDIPYFDDDSSSG